MGLWYIEINGIHIAIALKQLTTVITLKFKHQVPAVQRVNNTTNQINHYSLEDSIGFHSN